jgi:phosphoribosylanthranilate isomerase
MLKTKVKASSITNLTDARYFAAWEVEWLGFNLEAGSEDHIEPKNMNAIKEWVDGVKIVGEFNLPDLETVKSAIEVLEIEQAQVGPFTDYNTLKSISELLPVMQEIVVEKDTSLDSLRPIFDQNADMVEVFILNFDKNGIDWAFIRQNLLEELKELIQEHPILLSLNFDEKNIDSILEELQPLGINVKGGEEEKVGYKSYDELDEIFEKIEVLV